MIHNPLNPNQTLYVEGTFKGLPTLPGHGPFVTEYLNAVYRVLQQALNANRRVSALRLDLRFPLGMEARDDHISNAYITRFIESLKAKVRHNRQRVKERDGRVHDTDVRYVWAREVGKDGRVHYHVALLVSSDAFFSFGKLTSGQQNMVHRIQEAWTSALGLPAEQTSGLVHFPENAVYRFDLRSPREAADFFERASYLCKANTKQFGLGHHGFGASRH
jgi:hypothetical protein